MVRDREMQAFLDASALALRASCRGAALRAAEVVIGRLGAVGSPGVAAARVPACDWVAVALARAEGPLARAFAALEGRLRWAPRASSDGAFREGHANAVILGPGGLEARDDL